MTKQEAVYLEVPTSEYILKQIQKHANERIPPGKLRIITDTSDYFKVDYNDVVAVGEDLLLVRGHAREGRFGLDDEPKFWVKRAVDLKTGRKKILKLAFFERFEGKIGDIKFWFYRSPKKEGRILQTVRGHPNFMQGYAVNDEKGNVLRVLDLVEGPTLASLISRFDEDHEQYFYTRLPEILDRLVEAYDAIGLLHDRRELHGDIRRDHILVDRLTGRFVWIDFDYAYQTETNPVGFDLYGLGNVLSYVVGKGDVTIQDLRYKRAEGLNRLTENDMNIVWANRVMNLAKVFPYIPDSLNHVLMHFAQGAEIFYDSVGELVEDIRAFRDRMYKL